MQAKYKSSERETLIVSSVEHRAVGVHEDEMHLYLIPLLPCPVIGSRSSPHDVGTPSSCPVVSCPVCCLPSHTATLHRPLASMSHAGGYIKTAKSLFAAFEEGKPHSSITDWIEVLSSDRYEELSLDGIPELVESINIQGHQGTTVSVALAESH